MDDEEESFFGGTYENGTWLWSDELKSLEFISSISVEETQAGITLASSKPPQGGIVHFKDDMDILEQIRFRRRYQRKIGPGVPDIITLQDLKDLALYTAPLSVLSPALIELLHLRTTERFIRSLIFYCQYYLQVLEEMNLRKELGQNKIRTPMSDQIEAVFEQDLSELRMIIAKEYAIMLIGGDDTARFHHMGEKKKSKSLTHRDARIAETLLPMCVQIVWLALGRKSFSQIELEINRLFKTETFNIIEHNLKTHYIENMTPYEKKVFLGDCLRSDKKINVRSPLFNELLCCKEIDYSLLGIGVVSYPKPSSRIAYLAHAMSTPEDKLKNYGINMGILGMERSRFDILLRPLPFVPDKCGREKSSISTSSFKRDSILKKSTITIPPDTKIYPDIELPSGEAIRDMELPDQFPNKNLPLPPSSNSQKYRWLKRLKKLLKVSKYKC